jgi:hypothetical protein
MACKRDIEHRASGIGGARAVIEAEILRGRKWSEVLSADGVRNEVAQLSRKAAP